MSRTAISRLTPSRQAQAAFVTAGAYRLGVKRKVARSNLSSRFGPGCGLCFDKQLVHRLPLLAMAVIFDEIVVLVRIRLQVVEFSLVRVAPFGIPPSLCADRTSEQLAASDDRVRDFFASALRIIQQRSETLSL